MSANGVRIAAVIAVVLTMTVGCTTDGPQRSDARDSSLSSSLAPPCSGCASMPLASPATVAPRSKSEATGMVTPMSRSTSEA